MDTLFADKTNKHGLFTLLFKHRYGDTYVLLNEKQ